MADGGSRPTLKALSARVEALRTRGAVPVAEMRGIAGEILSAAGVPSQDAALAAEILCDAQLRAIDSHGLMHLPVYVRRLLDGSVAARPEMRVVRSSPAAVLLDAQNALGVLAAARAMQEAVALAKASGIGACSVRNSSHFGAASYFVARAAREGVVALAFSNAAPTMAPWGGTRPVLGTNPLAAAFPRADGEPVVIDMATSAVARARIRAAEKKGEAIPDHWALDEHGARTTDPKAALRGTIQPLGGEKGYALTLLIELLCATLSGGRPGFEVVNLQDPEAKPAGISHLFIAIDPEHFAGLGRLHQSIEAVAGQIEASSPGATTKPRLPGARAALEMRRRTQEGIPATEALVDSLQRAVKALA
jgi:LDH2 family malate/lactate/ureidoglycolate dehydrogenase